MYAKRKIVVFTDLDATLLDPHSYSWEPATEALHALRKIEAGLILVSSKTLPEMKPLHRDLGFPDPMIVENGGGIVWHQLSPIDLHISGPRGAVEEIDGGQFCLLPLGIRHEFLLTSLEEISRETGVWIRSFSKMSTSEVCSLTGLDTEGAERSQQRWFDEPFLIPGDSEHHAGKIQSGARARGLRAVRGGRFWHLMGHEGKGAAVALLMTAYRHSFGEIFTIGLGDSPNDFPFLELVDRPVLLGWPSEISSTKAPQGAFEIAEIGPVGWNRAVGTLLSLLQEVER